MKILDKYLLRSLLAPLAYCMAAFVLIFLIFDLFNNLEDFIVARTAAFRIVLYYASLVPSVLVYTVPISLILAALYSLSSLTKNNELTAMRASGISMYRMMLPYVSVGLLASLIVAAVNETIAPRSAYWTALFLQAERSANPHTAHVARNLAFRNSVQRREWIIESFNTRTFEMENIRVVQQRTNGTDAVKYWARQGKWLDNRWWFTHVVRQDFDDRGYPKGGPANMAAAHKERALEMTGFEETPQDFVSERKDARESPEQFSTVEILQYMQRHREFAPDTLARLRTDLHARIAMPWTCLVVILIGIPFGAQTGRKGAFIGVATALGMFFLYYALMSVALAMGKGQHIEPWLAAWLPNLVFLVVGIILLVRLR